MPGSVLILALIAGTVYAVRGVLYAVGARRAARPHRVDSGAPFVSIVIAARDEERNIGRCLDSLVRQTYPTDRFEILVLDDHSTDGTAAITDAFVAGHANVRRVNVHDEQSHLRGKARAVAQGIDVAEGEIIATTDADCRVGPDWLAHAVTYFDPTTGIVAGFTLQEAGSLFGAAQALDWGFLLSMASAGFGLRKPLGCIGNNLFFRRAAYEAVGGYRGIPFSITEDFALLQAVEHTGMWQYKYPADRAMLVWSEPCENVATLWRQKRRWALGGRRLGLRGYLVLFSSVLMDAAMIAAVCAGEWSAVAVALGARWIADAVVIVPSFARLGTLSLFAYFPLYELYAIAYELALPFGMLKRNVAWKGREF